MSRRNPRTPATPPKTRLLLTIWALLALPATAWSQTAGKAPLTVAEQSNYTKTSKQADVLAFLDKLGNLPAAKRLRRGSAGKTSEGRSIHYVIVSNTADKSDAAIFRSRKLRLLVNANIHAGEVEGKEAVQMLLRELALGQHGNLLEHAVLIFVPIYNVDGNERISKKNRVSQNGPTGGVGIRANAKSFDLNRDFIKVDCEETQALIGLWNRFDPHVFMDLHTTNGSTHGYHLTYAPSLATGVDANLRDFSRKTLLPQIRKAMRAKHDFRVYDYGNFEPWGSKDPKGWSTYDHRSRFATNCFGLRNRIAVLSEAYSYLNFKDRVLVTRAFVLETLRAAVARRALIRSLCAAADRTARQGGLRFGFDTKLETAFRDQILIGKVTRTKIPGIGTRVEAAAGVTSKVMDVRLAFESRQQKDLPRAWAIRNPPKKVLDALRVHGVRFYELRKPMSVQAETFVVTSLRKRQRLYQRHRVVSLAGRYGPPAKAELPARTLVVPAAQPLARLAAQLLEPVSEDALATWNYLDSLLPARLDANDDSRAVEHPVLRVLQ